MLEGVCYLARRRKMRYIEPTDRYDGLRLFTAAEDVQGQITWSQMRYFGQVCRPDFIGRRPVAARAELSEIMENTNGAAIRNYVRWSIRQEAVARNVPYVSPTEEALAEACAKWRVTDDGEFKRAPLHAHAEPSGPETGSANAAEPEGMAERVEPKAPTIKAGMSVAARRAARKRAAERRRYR